MDPLFVNLRNKFNILLLVIVFTVLIGPEVSWAYPQPYGCTSSGIGSGCDIPPLFDTEIYADPSTADTSITFNVYGVTGRSTVWCSAIISYIEDIRNLQSDQVNIIDSDIPELINQTIGVSYSGGRVGNCDYYGPPNPDLDRNWDPGVGKQFSGDRTFDSSGFPNGAHYITVRAYDDTFSDKYNTWDISFTISHPAIPVGTVCVQSNVATYIETSRAGGGGYADDVGGGAGYTCHGGALTGDYTATGSSLGGYDGPSYNAQTQTLNDGGTIYFDLTYTTSSVPGCTDSNANNYNPSANLDDGSCTYDCAGPSSQACTSGANSCNQTDSGTQTRTCNSSNGQWSDWGSCSAVVPDNPAGYGDACTSSANSCGQTSSGTIQCNGSCSASTPANSCVPGAIIIADDNPVSYGGSTTIRWTCNNSSAGSVPGIGSGVTGSGSTGALTSNTTYTVTCTGHNGTNPTASVTVNVSGPTVDIKANGSDGPITLAWNSNPTLAWTVANAASCTVSAAPASGYGNWSGSVDASTGTHSQATGNLVAPQTNTYAISCTGNGSASDSVYVTISDPVPSAPGSPTYSGPDYCSSGPGGYVTWSYSDPSGSPQSAYQVQITNTGNFNSPFYTSGKLMSSSHVFAIPNGVLEFGVGYKARVGVWNSYDQGSSWSNPTNTFNTPNYAYPDVEPPYQFTWVTDPKPQQNRPLQFTDHTSFGGGNPNSRQWSWNFGDGGTSTSQNPSHTYSVIGDYTITQTVTDAANQTCSYSQPLNIKKPIPVIKEVAPK